METNNSSSNGKSQNDGTQNNKPQISKPTKPRTMFLEYGEWKQGQHAISAIIKDPGDKRGKVAARIFIDFEGEPKHATYTAKNSMGQALFPPTQKLWELKKIIKENEVPLLEKAKLEKRSQAKNIQQKKEESILKKEAKAIGNKLLDEGKEFGNAAKDIIFGTGREQEIKRVRQRKVQRTKGVELEP